jgi:hypothetical protein
MPIFAGTIYGTVSMPRSVRIMYRSASIRMFRFPAKHPERFEKPGKQITLQNIRFAIWTFCTKKGIEILKNVQKQDVDILYYGCFVPH